MKPINIFNISRRENIFANQPSFIWTNSKILKLKSLLREPRMFHNHYHVFNSDTILTVLVKTRFIRNAHSDLKLNRALAIYALRAFVHTVKGAYAMSCPVIEVDSRCPEVLSCQNIEVSTTVRASARPHDSLEIQDTKKNLGVSFFLFFSRFTPTEMHCPSNIGGSIEILHTWIK